MEATNKPEVVNPFHKTVIKRDFALLNKIIFGPPKCGKTTLASCFRIGDREPLFLTTEDGHGAIEVYAQRLESWGTFIKVRDWIVANKDFMIKTYSNLVIDLASDLDEMCAAFIYAKYKIKSLADLDWGKGYDYHAEEFKNGINPLFGILPLTFITHTDEKEVVLNGEKVKTQVPTLKKRSLNFVNGKVDCTCYIQPANSKKDKPVLTFIPTVGSSSGSRFAQLAGAEFQIDYKDWYGTYSKINDVFAKGGESEVMEAAKKEIVKIASEAVKEG